MPLSKFTRRETRRLRRLAAEADAGHGSITMPAPHRQTRLRYAELTANLSAASNALTGATTATAHMLIPDPNSPGDLMAGASFTVTNRSLDLTGLSGDFLIVAPICGEWHPVWIDC